MFWVETPSWPRLGFHYKVTGVHHSNIVSPKSDLYVRHARYKKKLSKRTQPGQFEDIDEELYSNPIKKRKIEDFSKIFNEIVEQCPPLLPDQYKSKDLFELDIVCNFYT